MKKRILIILIIILALIILVTVLINAVLFFNPLLKSTESIRDDIIKQTPIGMSSRDVRATIENHNNWSFSGGSRTRGYINPKNPPETRIVGVEHITANLGKKNPFIMVLASWGFDENGKLIDVYVFTNLII